jgi:lipopolysaccharide transport system ATP-binding protein
VETAIRLDRVSKRFILRREQTRSFQELLLNVLHRKTGERRKEFWALQDVSLEIARGETVGLIGPNGAGKSTILKLISRIIEPTSGRIDIRGRVEALLELGAGFHPDLTGRENIYLNGSILGLSRAQIRRRLGEIVAFAELEPFIDTPVRHYSSGMYVRLGFSVAVHTDPEILLVDEVLAVGDAAFQQKCLDKISEFKRESRTVLFVSHNLYLVQQFCKRAIWLEKGEIQRMGPVDQVIASYAAAVTERLQAELDLRNTRSAAATHRGDLHIRDVIIVDAKGKPSWILQSGEPMCIRILYEATERVEKPVFSILIHRSDGVYISSTNTYSIDPTEIGAILGRGELVVNIDELDLYGGDYLLSVGAYVEPDPPYWSAPAHFLDKRYSFRVLSPGGSHGVVVLPARWEHHAEN